MLTYEQFLARVNMSDDEQAKLTARQEEFMLSLEQSLIDISIKQYPETEKYKHLFIDELTKLAHEKAVDINRLLDLILAGYENNEKVKIFDFKVPHRDVIIAEKEFLKDNIKNVPPNKRREFLRLNAERVKADEGKHSFRFLCCDKTKEIISEHFPELIDKSGNTICNIDKSTYLDMFFWVDDFFNLAGCYVNKKTTK